MRIAFLLGGPEGSVSTVIEEAVRALVYEGVTVDLIHPHHRATALDEVRVEHDLYALKSRTALTLGLAGALDALGAEIVNPYLASFQLRDKVVATARLRAAGVPTPDSFVAAEPSHLTDLLEEGPLVVKPQQGSRGRGVRVVRSREDLSTIHAENGVVFAQRYHRPDGPDRKIYRIGHELFGVERVWPATTYREKVGTPFEPTSEEREIALRSGRAFGIDLYGLDIVLSDGRPYVVDMSAFPGFKGVPEAGRRLAEYLRAAGAWAISCGAPLRAAHQAVDAGVSPG